MKNTVSNVDIGVLFDSIFFDVAFIGFVNLFIEFILVILCCEQVELTYCRKRETEIHL